jgi:GH24 family phage-related lysozyme (muramidase)
MDRLVAGLASTAGAAPQMSVACRRRITEVSEGRRLVAYRDCVGVWTIGYGHTSRAGPPVVKPLQTIAEAEADEILSRDLRTFEAGVAALLAKAKSPVAQCEFDALVDLAFNIGLGNLKSSSLLRAYLAGDRPKAAQKFMDWNKAGGRVVAGLTQRRLRDRAWFLTGRLPGDTAHIRSVQPDQAHAIDHPDALPARLANLTLTKGQDMKGYRTLLVGLALAVGPGALQYLGAVDWTKLIGPTGAFFVSGMVAIAMRAVTSTPLGKPTASAPQ